MHNFSNIFRLTLLATAESLAGCIY